MRRREIGHQVRPRWQDTRSHGVSRRRDGLPNADVPSVRITFETIRFGLGSAIAKIGLFRPRLRPPERLCLVLAGLGRTFIKFGQALSVRRDLLPDDYIVALQALQENIAPFPAEVAIREIE